MMKMSLLAGICLLFAVQAPAQDLAYARETIASLGSERMHGRGYAGKGDARAASFIRSEFINNGLIPLTPDYYQVFQVDVNTFPSQMELMLNGTRLTPGIDYIVEPSSPKTRGRFGVEIIDATDLLNHDSLLFTGDLKDRFILVDNRYSDDLDAGQKDALAKKMALIQDSPVDRTAGILELVQDQPSWGISGHVSLKPWFKVSLPAEPDTFVSVRVRLVNHYRQGYRTRNVAGYIRGTEYPDSFIFITAHYDHLGIMGKDVVYPGAHDNASGVAMMLYLSRYFQNHPPSVSIVFLAFSAEELGLVGSSYFVRHSPIDLSRIRFLVNLDMVGTGSSGIKVVNGTLYTGQFRMLEEINEMYRLLPAITARSATCISDHCPFDYQYVPGFYIYTEGDSPAYHSMHDRLEELSLAGFEGLARMLILFVSAL